VPVWQRAGAVMESALADASPTWFDQLVFAGRLALLGLERFARTHRLRLHYPRLAGGGGVRRFDGEWESPRECEWLAYRQMLYEAACGLPEAVDAIGNLWNTTAVPWGSLMETDYSHSYELVNQPWDPEKPTSFPRDLVDAKLRTVGSRDLLMMIGPDPELAVKSTRGWGPAALRRRYWGAVRLHRHKCLCPRVYDHDWELWCAGVEQCSQRFSYVRICDDLGGPGNWLELLPGGLDKSWSELGDWFRAQAVTRRSRLSSMMEQWSEEGWEYVRKRGFQSSKKFKEYMKGCSQRVEEHLRDKMALVAEGSVGLRRRVDLHLLDMVADRGS